MPRVATDISPSLSGGTTQAQLEDQGITYNEPGISYNEPGIMYGGLFGSAFVFPLISLIASFSPIMSTRRETTINVATLPTPHMSGGEDIYTTINPNARFTSIAPGFFMYITVPQ